MRRSGPLAMMGAAERGLVNRMTYAQSDRAVGAMVGMAVGNALGAGYAFEPRPLPAEVRMRAGGLGPYEAGEWGDDTAMAIPLLQVLQEGAELLDPETRDEVARRWVTWARGTKDLAPAVAEVLAAHDLSRAADSLQEAAAALHLRNPTTGAGNASLMRTTPVVLGFLQDATGLAQAARAYSDLTHGNPQAGDACVLWNLAQRRAIIDGEFDLAAGLSSLPAERQALWEHLITQAEIGSPDDFAIHNGWATRTMQTAWSAITACRTPGPRHFEDALRAAVAAGGDTPTVAAVTGGLLGARWGVSAIPLEWRRELFGWPGLRDRDLVWSVREALGEGVRPQFCSSGDASSAVAHPIDSGLLLGDAAGCRDVPAGVDAVVALCPLGRLEEPVGVAPGDQVDVWLIDSDDAADNPNLEHVVTHAVDMLLRLRGEGRTVYLASAQGRSRLPLVAAVYGARLAALPASEILHELSRVLPEMSLNPVFAEVLRHWD